MSIDDSQTTPDEAVPPPSPMSSADRARFWAGLNRLLRTEDVGKVDETE